MKSTNTPRANYLGIICSTILIGILLIPAMPIVRALDYQICSLRIARDLNRDLSSMDLRRLTNVQVNSILELGMSYDSVIQSLGMIAPVIVYERSVSSDRVVEYVGLKVCTFNSFGYAIAFSPDEKLIEFWQYEYGE